MDIKLSILKINKMRHGLNKKSESSNGRYVKWPLPSAVQSQKNRENCRIIY